jgi:hypothetical protein
MPTQNIFDIVMELQSKGLSDTQIISQLKNLGYTQQEISDAMNQAKAKAAVSQGEGAEQVMQPSILEPEAAQEEFPVPKPSVTKKTKKPAVKRSKAYTETKVMPETAYPYAYQEQVMPSYGAPASQEATATGSIGDIETIEEITEEIVAEKFSEIRNKITDMLDFKELIETKIQNLDDRVKRIESTLDKLQLALLSKVQEYSKDIKSLGSEVQALEGAFSKILNPLVDNVKKLDRITDKIKKEKKK